ncbi:DUF11 domain-containing protein [Streptomyces sp. NBRC 109706]|uniref:DUF7927 domain-containing protein n=1 Tax=Streptomyces sp. NBRC 109706 TaxID=1550035 RepID=UPI0007845D52|nr:DUF11 domain-containing protein [Streptomyces sp. NBRC 109706]
MAGATLTVLLGASQGLALAATPAAVPMAPPSNGSVLLNETFEGSQVDDPGFIPLDTACLTGAGAEPPPDASALGPCDGADQTTAPVPPPGVTPGYLQLTDSGTYRTGGVVYNRPLPGNGGLQVTFDQYQYGTNPDGAGADGIGFFLVDGSTNLTSTGATGGSLGYAQRNLEPGVDGGYVGVGLDAYGNFVNDFENRGNGCPDDQRSPVTVDAQVPNTVTLRGPGQGIEGYCYLTSTITPDATAPAGYVSTLPGSLREQGTDPEPALRTVQITVSPDELPTVEVDIDFHDGNGLQTVLTTQLTEEAPETYKFGFSASTGGFFDTHLIRDVSAMSVEELDNLNLVKTVTSGTTEPYAIGDTVTYEFLVTNTGTTPLTDVTVTDPDVTDVSCPRTTLGPAGSATSSMVCTGSHVIEEGDTLTDVFTNTATAQGDNPAGEQVLSNEYSASVPVVRSVQDLTIDKQASVTEAEPGDEVTYTVTVTNTGETTVDPAEFTDDLSDVLDDAGIVGTPTADTGTATLTNGTLNWTGTLTPGQTATITYTVRIDNPDTGDQTLRNSVTSPTPGAHCTGDTQLPCTTEVTVTTPEPPPCCECHCKCCHKPPHHGDKPPHHGHKPPHHCDKPPHHGEKPGHHHGDKPGHQHCD